MSAQAKNPFTLKAGQLMTGFGAGCGIGVGVGYPIALGSIPVLGEMMSATSSAASGAFGGVGYKAFGMLRKLGIKNLKAGVGCGVGFGHGFGVDILTSKVDVERRRNVIIKGIALKPGVSQQIVHSLQERLSAAAIQLQKYLPREEGETEAVTENLQPESLPKGSVGESSPGNKTIQASEKSTGYAMSDAFSVMKSGSGTATSSTGGGEVEELRQENEILRMLLRHQELIEDLKGQNASILRVLSEQFDVQIGGQEMDLDRNLEGTPSRRVARKNETFHTFHNQSHNPHRKCFDCRISSRRR